MRDGIHTNSSVKAPPSGFWATRHRWHQPGQPLHPLCRFPPLRVVDRVSPSWQHHQNGTTVMNFKDTNQPTTSESEVSEFEKRRGIKLPPDYRQFLLDYNGGTPLKQAVVIPDCHQEAIVDHFLGLKRNDEDIDTWLDELDGDMPSEFIPIGFDPGGNALLLDLTDGVVYYWDSSRSFKESSAEDNTYWVANSFNELIVGLKEDKEV
jgi:hypothetical protein